MKYDPFRHNRRSIRLATRDYAKVGSYFVTVVVKGHELLLEDLSCRQIVDDAWRSLAKYPYVQLDSYVIMPNHLHAIIRLVYEGGARAAPTRPVSGKPLGQLIGAFKTVSSKRINELRGTPGEPIWQRNYYERVLRSDELHRVRQYIRNNPKNWFRDAENPALTQTV